MPKSAVFVVDDSILARSRITRRLAKLGYEVFEYVDSHDKADAIAKLPDLPRLISLATTEHRLDECQSVAQTSGIGIQPVATSGNNARKECGAVGESKLLRGKGLGTESHSLASGDESSGGGTPRHADCDSACFANDGRLLYRQ